MCLKRNIEARSRNHWSRGEAISSTYYEYVFVALLTQHSKRMRPVTLPSVASPAVLCFSTLFQKLWGPGVA